MTNENEVGRASRRHRAWQGVRMQPTVANLFDDTPRYYHSCASDREFRCVAVLRRCDGLPVATLDAHICAPPLATTTIWPCNTPRLTRYVQGLLKRWVVRPARPEKPRRVACSSRKPAASHPERSI